MTAAIEEGRPRVLRIEHRGRRVAAALVRPAYALYTRRLRREVQAAAAPRHLAVILDGNRRWAAGEGLRDAGAGHRRGADKIDELLDWCAPLGIEEDQVYEEVPHSRRSVNCRKENSGTWMVKPRPALLPKLKQRAEP